MSSQCACASSKSRLSQMGCRRHAKVHKRVAKRRKNSNKYIKIHRFFFSGSSFYSEKRTQCEKASCHRLFSLQWWRVCVYPMHNHRFLFAHYALFERWSVHTFVVINNHYHFQVTDDLMRLLSNLIALTKTVTRKGKQNEKNKME